MKLVKISLFSAGLTLLKLGSGFIVSKLVAVYCGPGGLAMIGQVQGFATSLNGLVTAPVTSGLVCQTAEHGQDYQSGSGNWRATLLVVLTLSIATSIVICVCARYLATAVLGMPQFWWLTFSIAFALPFAALGAAGNAVLKGLSDFRKYFTIAYLSVIVGTLLMLFLISRFRLSGALISAAIYLGIVGVIVLALIVREPWMKMSLWVGKITWSNLKPVIEYTIMGTASAVCMPTAILFVRRIVASDISWQAVGYWQAVWKISEVYLGVTTLPLATYYLPRVAGHNSWEYVVMEMKKVAKLAVPVVLVFAFVIVATRGILISILFTQAFRPAMELFPLQLFGDVVKIIGWILAIPITAARLARWYVIAEVAAAVSFVGFTDALVPRIGLEGVNIAYVGVYLSYLIFMFVLLITQGRRFYDNRKRIDSSPD